MKVFLSRFLRTLFTGRSTGSSDRCRSCHELCMREYGTAQPSPVFHLIFLILVTQSLANTHEHVHFRQKNVN